MATTSVAAATMKAAQVAAIGRNSQIESLALKLGADVYIDSKVKSPAEELQKSGGAKCPFINGQVL